MNILVLVRESNYPIKAVNVVDVNLSSHDIDFIRNRN